MEASEPPDARADPSRRDDDERGLREEPLLSDDIGPSKVNVGVESIAGAAT